MHTRTSSQSHRRRRKAQTSISSDEQLAVKRGNSSSSLESEAQHNVRRQVTQEMELVEIGLQQDQDAVSDDVSREETVLEEAALCKSPQDDVHKYMSRREMTPLQERVNAITVIPGAVYSLQFLLSGSWADPNFMSEAVGDLDIPPDYTQCLSSRWLPNMHVLPPLPLIAVAVGILAHAPFSFIYHWRYAHQLPAGFARVNHWSRRCDQAMLHFCSACMAYATSGHFNFFLANLLFNIDCSFRHFQKAVYPKKNQARIAISVVAYTIPILRRGEWELFAQIWGIFVFAFLMFGLYPIGGWSHAIFHSALVLVPPLMMSVALTLPASQDQLKLAVHCAVLADINS